MGIGGTELGITGQEAGVTTPKDQIAEQTKPLTDKQKLIVESVAANSAVDGFPALTHEEALDALEVFQNQANLAIKPPSQNEHDLENIAEKPTHDAFAQSILEVKNAISGFDNMSDYDWTRFKTESNMLMNLGKLYSQNPELTEDQRGQVRDTVNLFLKKYNLDLDHISRVLWTGGGDTGQEALATWMTENFESIDSLENKRPGICSFLNKEFGIQGFARYSFDLLIKQYDERNDSSKPYGIFLQAVDDKNGAFRRYGFHKDVFSKESVTNANYSIRVIECDNKRTAVNLLLGLRKKYGQVSFGMISGHGTENGIDLSGLSTIFLTDLEQKITKSNNRQVSPKALFRYLFKKDAPIVLASCSTGAAGGIGQKASALGVKIIAPPVPADIRVITPIFNHRQEFVDFSVESTHTAYKRYQSGQEIQEEKQAA